MLYEKGIKISMDRRDFIKYGTILAGAGGFCFFCKNNIVSANDDINKNSSFDKRPCRKPFEAFEIYENGEVFTCCADFLKDKRAVGNIETQDIDEIWNGKVITEMRKKVLNGDFSMCNRDICVLYEPCSAEEISPDYTKGPKEIKINYDYECNYNCIKCRDNIIINSPQKQELYDTVYLPKVIKIAQNAEIVSISGSGDPLFSRHSRKLMKGLASTYPDIKFKLMTNGFLMNEKFLKEIGIENNIQGVSVSIDAVNRETYRQILRTDAFDIVMQNLELMSEWKKQGKINWITMNFVVHLMNYKEMPEFVKLAQKLDAIAYFTVYRPTGQTEYKNKYNEIAVFEKTNEHYGELVKILHNPVFKDEKHCYLQPCLLDIANS